MARRKGYRNYKEKETRVIKLKGGKEKWTL